MSLNKQKNGLARIRSNLGLQQGLISILFAVVWIDLLQYALPFFDLPLRLLLPVVLLVLSLQYQSHRAYFFVISVFLTTIILNAVELPAYWQIYCGQPDPTGLVNAYSICGICEVRGNLWMLLASTTAIALLHNRLLVESYQWNFRSFLVATLNAGLLYGLFRLEAYF